MGENPKKRSGKKAAKKSARKTTKKTTARSSNAGSGGRGTASASGASKGSSGERWLDRHLWEVQPVRDVLVVVGIVGLFWLGQKISIVTVPLLLAMLFAYLLEPVVRLLMSRTRLERNGSVMSILAAMVVLIVIPAILAATYGVIQGVGLVSQIASSTTIVYESIGPNREANEARRELESMTTEALIDQQASERAAEDPEGVPSEGDDASPEPQADPNVAESDAGEPLTIVSQQEYDRAKAELAALSERAQTLRDRVQREAGNGWLWVHDHLASTDEGGALNAVFDALRNWIRANEERVASSAAATGASVLQTTLSYAARAFALFFMIFLTAFFFYFMATGWPKVQLFVAKLIPDKNRGLVTELGGKFDTVISAFIRGRLTIAFIQSIVFTIGYFIIGVPAAFILGPIVAILSIVPYLASVGIPISIALLWFENHTGVRGNLLYVVAAPTLFYFIGQALDDYVLTPKIQGKSTGMSTPAILFASIAGGVLFGFFGLLIAIPLAACIKILLDEIFWPHFKAWTEGKTKDLLPFGRE